MSLRPILKQFQVVTNGDMSGNITGRASVIEQISVVSYSFAWTGTPDGDFSVEVSNDFRLNSDGTVGVAGTWTPLPLSANAQATGSPDYGAIDVHNTGFYAIRPVYTSTSGAGSLNVIVNGKVA